MATTAAIGTTIGDPGASTFRFKQLVLLILLLVTLVTAVAVVRLAAVVSATPAEVWREEYPRLFNPSLVIDPATAQRARRVAEWLDDPALIRAQQRACWPAASNSGDYTVAPSLQACLVLIDKAIAASPGNGELWLGKARALATFGQFGALFQEAFANAYRVARREGWLASERVILGLQLYPVLPPALQASVRGDLELVLSNRGLAAALAAQYAENGALRETAAEPLRLLSPKLADRFVRTVRDRMREPAQ